MLDSAYEALREESSQYAKEWCDRTFGGFARNSVSRTWKIVRAPDKRAYSANEALSSPPRVYVDTSVVIHFLHPASEQGSKKATAFFLDIESGKFVGVLSDFCKLEYSGYLKEELAMVRSGKVTKKDVELWLDKFDQLEEEYGLEEVSADSLLATPFVTDCMDIVHKSEPKLVGGNEWLVVKGADSVHAVLASRCGADFLATLDNGFRGLSDTTKPMILWDLY